MVCKVLLNGKSFLKNCSIFENFFDGKSKNLSYNLIKSLKIFLEVLLSKYYWILIFLKYLQEILSRSY